MQRIMKHFDNNQHAFLLALEGKQNISKTCIECSNEFVFDMFQQLEFEILSYNEPSRCQFCRRNRKLEKRTRKHIL